MAGNCNKQIDMKEVRVMIRPFLQLTASVDCLIYFYRLVDSRNESHGKRGKEDFK